MKERVLGNFFSLDFFDDTDCCPSEILSRELLEIFLKLEIFLLSLVAIVGDCEKEDPLLADPIDSDFR